MFYSINSFTQLQTAEINVKEAIEESTRRNGSNVELRNKVS